MRVRAVVLVLLMSSVSALSMVSTAVVPPAAVVKLDLVAGGFTQPVDIKNSGDGTGRLFVVEQAGLIKVVTNGVVDPVPWLDARARIVCCGERGLLGIAFHPDFEANGVFVIDYTAPGGGAAGQEIVEKFVLSSPLTQRPGTTPGQVLLTWPDPYTNHNGGGIAFGPDGYVYYAIGDGGNGGDPQNRAQNPNELLGKMLRIDVMVPTGYAIPAGNPYANGGGKPEIYAIGLRNPWRWSFDRANGDLWIADVGQNLDEEVDYVPAGTGAGRNFGWRMWEGHLPYNQPEAVNSVVNGQFATLTFPVVEYPHFVGEGLAACSITGGYVYRGPGSPLLQGHFVYGDYCSGMISMVVPLGNGAYAGVPLIDSPYQVTTFGEDEPGNLYVSSYAGGGNGAGAIYKVSQAV
jgi:glucose/arabinose dehydrogenase